MKFFLPCFLSICATLTALQARPTSEQPNFIVIFIDDMGYGDVGFNGATGPRTPHLDRMAAEGMRFDDFYVGCPVCSGSRTALLTGAHYQRLSMSPVLFPHSDTGLHPDEVTIADLLREEGYRTACVGKWHLGHLPPCLPTYQGFDSYFGVPYSNDMWIDPANRLSDTILLREGLTLDDLRKGHKKRNRVPLMRDEEVIEYPADQKTLTKRYTEEAVRFIRESREEPFFLYLPHTMVHLPLAVSEAFERRTEKLIWDAIEEVDWSVGQVLDTLREEGLSGETLVVFTSDNGAAVGSSLPLRSSKASVYDGGIRVPTLMWWPGQIPAGSVCEEVAATIDLLPTFAGLAGGKLPEREIDGHDIWPLLSGEPGARSPHDAYVLMHRLGAVRSGKWKFYPWSEARGKDRGARVPGREPSTFPVQLYDVDADIGETTNVAEQHPEVVARLQEAWESHVADIEATRRPTAKMVRPEGVPSPERPWGKGKTELFTGLNLNQWEMEDPDAWVIENDMLLTCQMKEVVDKKGRPKKVSRGYLWTKESYDDFILSLDYRLSEGANSGVFFRSDAVNPVQGVFEILLLDNASFREKQGVKDAKKQNGALYDAKAPASEPSKPAGEWNTLELHCKGPQVRVKINGIEVLDVDVTDWDTPGMNPDGTPNKFKSALKDLPRRGHIGLQNHGQPVWFRDIWLRTP